MLKVASAYPCAGAADGDPEEVPVENSPKTATFHVLNVVLNAGSLLKAE